MLDQSKFEYDSVDGRVKLDPNGPSDSNPAGWTIIGPNQGSGGLAIAGTAVAISQGDSPAPGPADVAALGLLIYAGYTALTHEVLRIPTISRPFLNENADANSAPSNPEPDAGNFSDKIGKIATALGATEKEVREALHKVKRNLKVGGKTKNPDMDVDLNTGEVYPKIPGGGRGDSIGNIWEYLP